MCGLLVSRFINYVSHAQYNGLTWEAAIFYSCFLLNHFLLIGAKIEVIFHHQPKLDGGDQGGNHQDLFSQLMDKTLVMSMQG